MFASVEDYPEDLKRRKGGIYSLQAFKKLQAFFPPKILSVKQKMSRERKFQIKTDLSSGTRNYSYL
jgi:hypothetical protein